MIRTKAEPNNEGEVSVAHHKEVNIPWPKVFLGLALLATVAGALFATKTLSNIDKNIAAAKEAQRPANIKLTKITVPNCSDCFNVDDAVTTFKKQNVQVGEEKTVIYDSDEGKSLIKSLGVSRVPTYVFTGEVNKNNLEGFVKGSGEVKNNTFIFTKVTPIFIDATTGKQVGKVVATILTDPSCFQCINPKLTIESYKKAGIKILDQKEISWNSSEGQRIVNQYKITKVPTFVLSSDIGFYDNVKNSWSKIGTVEQDKTYVARNLFLPYRDLEKGQILGLVDIVYLTDSTCGDCYDPIKVQKAILTQGYGVGLRSERSVDANSTEGRSLVNNYKITQVPTILLSPDVDQYQSVKAVWPNVGTVESDGWYVFRKMQQLGSVIYKDLASNQIIKPASTQGTQGGQVNQ